MTRRSILWAFIFVALLSAVTFYNDQVVKNTHLIGNFLPVSVFGTLTLFVMLFNPLLRRIRQGLALTATELAAAAGIALCACYPLGRGLGHYFTTFLMMPHHFERTTPAWQGEPAKLIAARVRDWSALRERLQEAERRPEGDPLRAAAARLPPDLWASPLDTPARQEALLSALNGILSDPDYRAAVRPDRLPEKPPQHVRLLLERDPATLSAERSAALYLGLIETALGDAVRPRRPGVLERAPRRILADPSGNPAVELDGFTTGMGEPNTPFPLSRIPWRAWTRTLLFWIPLIATMSLTTIGLALVLHRQWARHEHLPYPTVEFARAILPAPGSAVGAVFRERIFWVGLGVVFLIHMVNYLNRWFPDYVIPVNLQIDLTPLLEIAPVFRRGNPWAIFTPTLYFTAIGFAFFLTADVSLSLGLAPYVFALAAGVTAGYGVAFGAGYMRPSIETSIYAGALTAMFLTILYSGRFYLRSAFARGLGLRGAEKVEPAAVWGARATLAGIALFAYQLVAVGVEWPLALLYTVLTVMIFTVMSRLLAEAGVFFFKPNIFSCTVLWSFMGAYALGPDQFLILSLISSLLLIDPRETLMPFVVTSLKLGDDSGAPPGRIAAWGFVAVIMALLIATTASLYWQYREGGIKTGDGWTASAVPRMALDINAEAVRSLEAQGRLETAGRLSGLARFAHASPRPEFLIPFGVAFGLVFLFTFLRHRFARWPLHPLIFLMGFIYESRMMGPSFLLGWFIKAMVTKYGGARAYQRVKPLMIGLVAGELMASLVPLIVSAIYNAVTGLPPPSFRILPG